MLAAVVSILDAAEWKGQALGVEMEGDDSCSLSTPSIIISSTTSSPTAAVLVSVLMMMELVMKSKMKSM